MEKVGLKESAIVLVEPGDGTACGQGGVWYLLKGVGGSVLRRLVSASALMRLVHKTSWILPSC